MLNIVSKGFTTKEPDIMFLGEHISITKIIKKSFSLLL